ncbi:MAG: formylglycine-generating enzyme family protein, partial [Thermoanaerobaculia bacterium]|nr:formylglycine-generating enzyme family protein [Thermoanaerobaculia bacterium]
FSGAVIDGLRGEAAAGPDGWITVQTLAVFLQERVSAWVKKNRPSHVVPVQGIGQRIDGPGSEIPLAPHPAATKRRQEYRARRAAAEARLGGNLGGVLTGTLIDQVLALLPADEPNERAERVLAEVEALDGSESRKRSLRDLVRELRGEVFSPGLVTDWPEKKPVPAPTVPLVTEPAAGSTLEGPLGMRLRFVPSGIYWIGSPAEEVGRNDDEIRYEVEITRGFWLAETVMTQGQWKALVPSNPSHFKTCGDDCPVERVSWWEAVAFANLLSERHGLEPCYELAGCNGTLGTDDYECRSAAFRGFQCTGYRLPSEAEWEVAARAVPAGSQVSTAIYPGVGSADLGSIAWYWDNSRRTIHPVGNKLRNAWGFADMLGTVFEWTGDWSTRYLMSRVRDPLAVEGPDRVIRGSSWLSQARDVRAAFRCRLPPSYRVMFVGFRLARGQVAAPG